MRDSEFNVPPIVQPAVGGASSRNVGRPVKPATLHLVAQGIEMSRLMRRTLMRKNISHLTCLLLLASLSGFFACSKDNPRGQNREATPAQQSSSPTSQAPTQQPPAAPQSPNSSPQISVGAKVTGTPATEKYHLRLTNYAKVPVTVSINGEWIGL